MLLSSGMAANAWNSVLRAGLSLARPLPSTVEAMAIAVVVLRGGDYRALATAMEVRGFARWLIADGPDGRDLVLRLPRGVYWRAEPNRIEDLIAAAREAVAEIGEPGAQIIVTVGESRWHRLPPVDEG